MTKVKYEPSEIEPRWQKAWTEANLYHPDLSKPNKIFVLAEFPYSSGDLHIGHWFTFCGADIYARYKRMQGFNVFFPNGFDAFGLPAENAAINRKIHPMDWTLSNIERMKTQFLSMGASFSFDHQVITCLPEYYKWNQWLFLKMFEKDLTYRAKFLSNWCPVDQTVLANEAIEGGRCWRCGAEVVQKEVEQWFFKITDYADRLIWEDQPGVDWPKALRDSQNDWIGKKDGINIDYEVEGTDKKISVFTTRPDTNFGASFIAIAPEHPLALGLATIEHLDEVRSYVDSSRKKTELERKENKDKTGVFTGSYALNPLTNNKMPIWISDFVLSSFGTGALVGVPGHDKRDFEFAQKFKLEIKRVIIGSDGDTSAITKLDQVQENEGKMINSEFLDGMDIHTATQKIMDYIEEKDWGKRKIQYHLHDWSVSRQRYWGTPIPIIHCPKCGMVPVQEQDLPVELPYEVDYTPKGKPPLASNEEWLKVKCPKCGGNGKRDDETMDAFVDSSWYFFRYLDPTLDTAPFPKDLDQKIMPVDIYFGGAEHTLGHTLYSRFITKVFFDLGLTHIEEYAKRRINHGVVLGPDGFRMSKSRGNVVNPDVEVKKYGTDAVRVYLSFFMPYDGTGPWQTERIWGPYRFLERIWNLQDKISDNTKLTNQDLVMMHTTIKKVGEDIERIKFNTAVASLMKWLNNLSSKNQVSREEYVNLIKLLSPFAPHLTEHIWHNLGSKEFIHQQSWPKFDSKYIQGSTIKIAVAVNGKVRDSISVDAERLENKEYVEKTGRQSKKLRKFIGEKSVKSIIYIPGKIINFIVG